MAADQVDLALRIVIVDPVPEVALAMQRGKSGSAELIAPSSASADAVGFDFTVAVARAEAGQPPRLLGPFVQGPPDGRFVYVCIGVYAGDAASPWARRAKIPLTGLTWPLIEGLKAGSRLEARIAGRARDGSPACASLPLLPPGWREV
jgi:Family of unknown function (DUF5990)